MFHYLFSIMVKKVTHEDKEVERGDILRATKDWKGIMEGMEMEVQPYALELEDTEKQTLESEKAGIALKYKNRNGEIDFEAVDVFEAIEKGTLKRGGKNE